MAKLLKAKAGSVFIEEADGPQYFTIQGIRLIDNPAFILTRIRIARQESLQHIKTMTSKVYTYAFGELPGQVSVGGIMFFTNSCGVKKGKFGDINKYYEERRAYKGLSRYIAIGGAAFKVTMSSLEITAEASGLPFGQFSINYTILPQEES